MDDDEDGDDEDDDDGDFHDAPRPRVPGGVRMDYTERGGEADNMNETRTEAARVGLKSRFPINRVDQSIKMVL